MRTEAAALLRSAGIVLLTLYAAYPQRVYMNHRLARRLFEFSYHPRKRLLDTKVLSKTSLIPALAQSQARLPRLATAPDHLPTLPQPSTLTAHRFV